MCLGCRVLVLSRTGAGEALIISELAFMGLMFCCGRKSASWEELSCIWKGTVLYLHANSPVLAVAVKEMNPVSAIMFGSKCHNSLTCKRSANQHGCCVQSLYVGGGGLDTSWEEAWL